MTAEAILQAAVAQNLRIGVVETSAGGTIAAALTALPGASAVLEVALLPYSDSAKQTLLGTRPDTVEAYGAVSEPMAREMAAGLLARFPIDIALAETGITGPGGSAYKPEGRCCFALAQTGRPLVSETMDFGAAGRAANRAAFRDHALALLARRLQATT